MNVLLPSAGYSWTDLASLLLAVVGGAFGLWQYYRSNKEARARAAADEIERFNSDESVKTALRIIDWHSGSISYVDEAGERLKKPFGVAEYHLALRPHIKARSEVRGYRPEDDKYRAARVASGAPFEDYFSPLEQYVRDVFDAFLGRLERIEMLIECGVIGEKNFGDMFSYWLHVIGDEKKTGGNFELNHFSNSKREALIEYITYYRFEGVMRLFSRYGKRLG